VSKKTEAEEFAYKLSPDEANAVEKVFGRQTKPRLTILNSEPTPTHVDERAGFALLMEALGTTSLDFGLGILKQLTHASITDVSADQLNFMVAVIEDLEPRDHFESMLIAQAAVMHVATMRFARHLNQADNLEMNESTERTLNRLARTFTSQMEALKRYRNAGEQTVTVKHITANEGTGRRRRVFSRSSGDSTLGQTIGSQPDQNAPKPSIENVDVTVPISAARTRRS
jgi:hypothetical protein